MPQPVECRPLHCCLWRHKNISIVTWKGRNRHETETKNGLNILDIACIHNKTDFGMELVKQ